MAGLPAMAHPKPGSRASAAHAWSPQLSFAAKEKKSPT